VNDALELDPQNLDYMLTLSDVYLQMGNGDQVVSVLHKAIDLYPGDPKPYLQMGELYIVLENYRLAFDYLNKAVELDNADPEPFFMKGLALLETGDTLQAIENFQSSVEKDQNYIKAYVQLGNIMLLLNNRLAVNYYENAYALDPTSADIMYMLGFSRQQFGLYDDAVAIYNELLVLDSSHFLAEYNLGYVDLMFMDDYLSAIEHFSRAIDLYPDYFDAYYNRGLCYEILGELDSARENYEKALKIEVNYPKAIEGLNRLDKMKGD